MGTLQFHIQGFPNDPRYQNQKEFLKFCEENLKYFNLSSRISARTGLDRAWDIFLTKLCNRSFKSVNEKSFTKKILKLMHRDKSDKMAKWQNGCFLPNSHFGTFVPLHWFQKFFLPNDFFLSVMKDLLLTFAQKVSLALSRAVHVLIRGDKLNYFKFPS